MNEGDPFAALFEALSQISEAAREIRHRRSRPILGGAFGVGRFDLCSIPTVAAGLDAVLFLVVDRDTNSVLAAAHTAAQALSSARRILNCASPLQLATFFADQAARQQKAKEAERLAQVEAEKEYAALFRGGKASKVRSIPRRRRQIFEESQGQCHYCGTALDLEGSWHIEHKMPKALGGGNERTNLVAACVSCNQQKKDRTDIEFIESRSSFAATPAKGELPADTPNPRRTATQQDVGHMPAYTQERND
jgi:hypothetical protein